MRYSSRFFLYAPIVLLLLLATGVMVWWKISAGSFDARLAADNDREIVPGVRMHYASKNIGGFPFRLDAVLDGFSLAVQTRTGPLVWRAGHFAMHALTYGPNRWIFEAAGMQTLTWTDGDGRRHRYDFVPGSLRASATMFDRALARFDLEAVAIVAPALSAGDLQFHMRREPRHDAIDFVASGKNILLEPSMSAGFGKDIRQLDVEGRAVPATPLGALLTGNADWRAAADEWRRARGYLSVQRMEIAQDGVRAAGSANLTLDASHTPAGVLQLRIDAANRLPPVDPSSGKLALALRAHPTTGDGRLSATLTILDGTVRIERGTDAGRIDPLY